MKSSGFLGDLRDEHVCKLLIKNCEKNIGNLDVVICNLGSGKSVVTGVENLKFWLDLNSIENSEEKARNLLAQVGLISFSDDLSLRLLYSAADVMVVPSIQEAFGQTASEAQACGTPVAAFKIGGLLDVVSHKETGYLADPYDPKSLAYGINWIIEDEERNEKDEKRRV